MKILALVALCSLLSAAANAAGDFVDHGVGAPVAESRGVIAAQDEDGRSIALALSLDRSARGWMLVTDIDTEETTQHYYPEGVPNSAPFASLLSKNGRFYTFAGKTLLEFDLTAREWLFHGVPAASESCVTGSAMVDGADGLIYAGTYPNCHLVCFDPESKEMKDLAQLDPAEHYVNQLVADASGWVYAGIGTARQNVVACDPKSGEVVQIAKEEDRVLGSGEVYLGNDGQVYGRAAESWYRLSEGKATEIAREQAAGRQSTGAIGWGARSGAFPDGRKLRTLNLPERWMEIEDAEANVKRITFDYESEGASITSLTAGPDGRIYTSTCHPMHFVAYDPAKELLEDLGPLARVGGGNFCAMDVQGDYLFGVAYSGAHFYLYDTTKAWNNETGDEPNPRVIAQFKGDITRPRACLAHPDGRHVIMAGFAGYGMCGGGLGIYDIEADEAALLTHEEVIPYHSTITMRALPDGNVVGGTSIHTPGGGHPQAKEGALYIMDWESRKVVFQTVPVPGATEVFSIEVGPEGLVYGLASGSQLFVFDPEDRKVIHQEDMSEYGGLPRQTLVRGPDGNIYAAFTGAIVRIQPGSFEHEKLAEPPTGVSAGVVIREGRLYYASGSHLWSYGLELEQ